MSKKRAPKTAAPLNHVTNTVENGATIEAAPDPVEDVPRPKGKKSKGDKKNKAAKAAEGDTKEKREKKEKRGKKSKKEKAAKAVKESKQDRESKRDKPKGKKNKSTPAPELRPLRKVNVQLIEPNGQPYAHFDGEIGVLELMLPKKAEA